ncbi:rRNA maturation RNase YbeY [Aliiroseovarius sp. PTFE2010]|uniref:rRNA maturation RNase YbeY n=1 Tax=Aliiroseovarius sp. PTFE2010 TaxID=3417190 RepID=UPI003CEC65DC
MIVDTVIEDDRWADLGLERLAETAFAATLAHLDIGAQGLEVALLACDDARIAALNADFREKPTATNVLSWPSEDRAPATPGAAPAAPQVADGPFPTELGDIAIAYDTCAREAAEQAKPLADHVTHLLVHGLLHLLGYDHIDDQDATVMERHEVAILASMGLADPYS